ncbi:hypothetical protein [Hoylesella buccalis]|uniref:hypothetical protein n=1 Tax=Hoylesella buccalis TaxID=28127 RepID=UPI0026ED6B2B|nr:hypothetical protein [Hoylesella buccalis]
MAQPFSSVFNRGFQYNACGDSLPLGREICSYDTAEVNKRSNIGEVLLKNRTCLCHHRYRYQE